MLEPDSPPIEALSRWKLEPLSARRRMLKNPSGVVSVADTCDDLPIEGERLSHATTTSRTEFNGERGDVCGRFSDVPWVVALALVKLYEVGVL